MAPSDLGSPQDYVTKSRSLASFILFQTIPWLHSMSQENEGIFKDQGKAVKFFIQRDLGEQVINELTAQIKTNGGSVEGKVPVTGYLVIDPTSSEGVRLYECWNTADRPFRRFAPPTFVSACLQAGRLLPQPLRDHVEAEQKRIHIHPSITDEKVIESITTQIWNAGGDPTATEQEADVIIAEETSPIFDKLVHRYDHNRDKFVEPIGWVQECVEFGCYQNTPFVKKNKGGRPKGKRTEFTALDDKKLAEYIASRLPDPSMRGRTGNRLYQDLCSRPDLYEWAERHPWQSWRERYKNNTNRLNQIIAQYVKQHPAPPNGKGLHGHVRTSKPKSSPTESPKADKSKSNEKSTSEDDESHWDIREGKSSPPAWYKGKRKAEDAQDEPEDRKRARIDRTDGEQAPKQEASPEPRLSPAKSPNPDGNTEVTNVNSDEADEVEYGIETQILLEASQKMLADVYNTSSKHGPPNVKPATKPLSQTHSRDKLQDVASNLPSADQVLAKIAGKYRFILEEVRDVYEDLKCDLGRTEAFFKEARLDLLEKRNMWKRLGREKVTLI